MAAKFFGQFLIEKKVISGLNLLKAIELQEQTNHRFGDLVLEMNLMTEEQIYLTHRNQRHEDLQFGDMAVKMGFLTPDQVKEVLEKQQHQHLYIGEALVATNAISAEDLKKYLAEFKRIGSERDLSKIEISENIQHHKVLELFAEMTFKMLTRITGATFKVGQSSLTSAIPEADVTIGTKLTGDVSGLYFLTMGSASQQLIAETTTKDIKKDKGYDLDTAVLKFVNIICGNAISKSAIIGYKMTSQPASYVSNIELREKISTEATCVHFPIFFSNGEESTLALVVEAE